MLVANLQYISKEDFLKLKEEDVMFISNPGRQGDEDGSTFLIKQGEKCIPYRVDGWMYGPKDGEDYISMEDAFKVFPEWRKAWYSDDNGDTEKYEYIYMGVGNGLSVDKSIYDKFEPYFKKACKEYADAQGIPEDYPSVTFNSWKKAIIDMGIIDDKYLEEYNPEEHECPDNNVLI